MIKIAPSILSADFANLERDIRRVSSADWLHVDVMDGCFVPNLTIGVPVVQSIRKCTGMFLDVHLMIDKTVRYVEAFAQAGLYRSMRARTWRMVSNWCSRKAWPPKPGSTVITSTMSSPSR